jgi:hypothetical protein
LLAFLVSQSNQTPDCTNFDLPVWTASLRSASIARKMSTTTTSWEMKHKKTEPKKWAKILPQSWREKMAKKNNPKISVLNLHGTIMAAKRPGYPQKN